ncbi:MAG: hypothetical protein ACRDJF_09725 [Actinomycetota bacterium]
MDELTRWLEPLDRFLDAAEGPSLTPSPREVKLLLEMGKLAAEGGPQRYFALLAAYVVGRGLGRAEAGRDGIDPETFLEDALACVQEMTGS